jgi:hypothetical protein
MLKPRPRSLKHFDVRTVAGLTGEFEWRSNAPCFEKFYTRDNAAEEQEKYIELHAHGRFSIDVP